MWGKPRVVVRRYKTEREYQRDAGRMVKRGYRVAHVVSEMRNAGCMRWLTIGLFALIFKPSPEFVVTYQRE